MRKVIRYFGIRSFAIAVIAASFTAHAQDVKVMCSGAFASAYKMLAPQYEKSSGAHLEIALGASMGTSHDAIPVRLARGETADVVILARPALDNLVKQGEVVAGSQVDLARSRIGMAVRAGDAIPDISSVEAFRKVLLQAHSVAYSDSASGVYIASELFKRLGIEKEMAAKSRQIPGTPVGEVVARGEVEIGFQQLSELQPVSGITIVGPIPEELQSITVFSAGVATSGPSQDAGRALIRYLASPGACSAMSQTSLDPVTCSPIKSSTDDSAH